MSLQHTTRQNGPSIFVSFAEQMVGHLQKIRENVRV